MIQICKLLILSEWCRSVFSLCISFSVVFLRFIRVDVRPTTLLFFMVMVGPRVWGLGEGQVGGESVFGRFPKEGWALKRLRGKGKV